MSFKSLAQYNRSADAETSLHTALFGLVLFESKWVKPFLLNPYIIWPCLCLKSGHKTAKEGRGDSKGKTDSRNGGKKEDFTFLQKKSILR